MKVLFKSKLIREKVVGLKELKWVAIRGHIRKIKQLVPT